jgi:hypothetical protein
MAEDKSGRRSCGECTVCCEGWLSADIRGHKMGGGQPCHFLEAGGCSIYGSRPDLCRSFECGWLMAGSRFPEEWRPDKVGFFIQAGEWDGGKCWLLHHTGQDPSEAVLQVMREHTKATGEPHIVVKRNSWLCYGMPEFQQAMVNFKQGESPAVELKVNFLSKDD